MRRKRCSVCNLLFDSDKLKNGECPTCRRKGAEQPSNPTKSVSETSKDSGITSQERPSVLPTVQKLADRLKASKDTGADNAPHLIIEARAGTGKTTTLIEGLKRVKGLPTALIPSPQQAKVWESMELSKGKVQTICFVAFNKSVATELQSRVPAGCDAMTMHSLGFKAVQKAFGRVQVNSFRVQDIISELLEKDIRELRRTKPEVIKATEELVGLCKMNLTLDGVGTATAGYDQAFEMNLEQLASYYDVDTNGHATEIFDLVPRVLERCKDVAHDGCIDFNDMIWIPVVLDLNVYKYDILLIDEFQDCNRCNHALAKKAGKRLICCGDPKQAIYGFAGADAQSMARMEKELASTERGCLHLPLTVTRRCGKAIVAEARKIVPDFEAFETNPEGKISRMALNGCGEKGDLNRPTNYRLTVQDGDMILCRCNAPLVSECFRFIRAGRKANIQGRDVGAGLIKTVQKVMKGYAPSADYLEPEENARTGRPATDSVEMMSLHRRLDDWLYAEQRKEREKRNPSEQRLVNLQDRRDCLMCFTEGANRVEDVIRKIEQVFTDDKSSAGIRLSSVHKAKGLEADRIFILTPKESPMPHPMAKLPWEKEGELNILYVAITRAKNELIYVS